MKNINLNQLELEELKNKEKKEVEGGVFPLIILGVPYSAKVVLRWTGICFFVGLAIGLFAAMNK